MYTEKHYVMWLNSLYQIGLPQRIRLYDVFGSAHAVWNAKSSEICRVTGMTHTSMYHLILTQKDTAYIDKLVADCSKAGARFICRDDDEFPELLRHIDNCPLGLYIIGSFPEEQPKIAMVGSRVCTEYGASSAYNISRDLAQYNAVIVSGMAEGIDSYAHKGAIDGGAKTIAVMGTGIDLCYPTSNRSLREKIIQNGCIISEYPTGLRGTAFTFPMRNRIISGLSQAVIVVEAAKRSGSLITVDHALSQGREVFAVPGNINSSHSMGCNMLIKTGANVLTSAEDIAEYFSLKLPEKKTKKAKKTDVTASMTEDEKAVYCILDETPRSIEEIAQATGFDTRTLQSVLSMLEINGYVTKLSGQRYIVSNN